MQLLNIFSDNHLYILADYTLPQWDFHLYVYNSRNL